MISHTQTFKNAMLSPQVKMYIKIELYDSKYKFIKTITQQVTSDIGTLAVNSDSPIRRSFKINLDNSLGEFIFGEKNLIWLDKRLKLFIGLQTWDGSLEWVPQGVFVLTDPEDNHTLSGKTASINAVDKAFLMTDNRGKFVNEFIIAKDANIVSTIKTIAGKVGETLFNFDTPDTVNSKVKYELTYSGEDNYFKAIQELASMAKCQVFYDVNGYLRLKKVDLAEFDNASSTWNYVYGSSSEKLYAGNVRVMNISNLFNDIVVIGGGSENASVKYRLTVDDTKTIWKNHPYSVQKIGWNTYCHNGNSPDPALSTVDDCKYMAKKLLMEKLGFDEDIQLTISPNYLHDANDVITIKDSNNGLTGDKYIIKSATVPLSPQLMTMEISRYRPVISDWNFI
jgi:hypothetical protein